MRHFYTELVGLDEFFFSDDDRSIGYRCGSIQFSVHEVAGAEPSEVGFASQPGWDGGTTGLPSWSVTYSEDQFHAAVERLRAAGVPAAHGEPAWVHYWSYPVLDPMGNTVEITYAPVD